jgi:hypothetical protein
MEFVKHHVAASGNSSLRGFFGSDNVDFDPPSLSLRQNITKAKAKYVYDLADGFTDDDDEDAIRDTMTSSENSYELIRMVGAMGGWEGLDDELTEAYLDQIGTQLAQVLDQRDYVVYQLIRRYLVLLDYNIGPNSPTLGDCFTRLMQWPVEFQADEIDLLLSRKADLLKGITSATMRDRTNMVNAARILPAVIQSYLTLMPHRFNELVALMHEANYTTRIGDLLVRLDYSPLYQVIADMVNPGLTNAQRIACRDTCMRMSLEFAAAAKAVEVVGSNEAKSTVNRFMETLKAALDNFPPTLPAPGAVAAIIAVLGSVGNTLSELMTAVSNLPDALAGAITLGALLGTDDDDKARQLTSEMSSQGCLANASFKVKITCINAALDGWTVDDDENSINRVMQASKWYCQAELYQLAAAATWDSLYSGVDGDEYDTLLGLLQDPA